MLAISEGIVESGLIFYAFISLNPILSIILMCGIFEFSVTQLKDIHKFILYCKEKCKIQHCARNCTNLIENKNKKQNVMKWILWAISHVIMTIFKLVFILVPLFIAYKVLQKKIIIATILIMALSLIWSGKLQKTIFSVSQSSKEKAKKKLKTTKAKGRWKASKLQL